MSEGAARANWEERLAKARKKLGLWKARSLSFLGKVLALKVDVLPSLLYLAHVYPMPRFMRRGLTRDVFNLVWGGRYEYVKREVMYLGKDKGGRDVPDFPLKLDCLFFAQLCARLAAPLQHPHQYFVRLWLSWPLRPLLSTWSNSGPKAETLPDYYEHLVRWSRSLPAGLRPESYAKHRALYKAVLDGRGTRVVVGLEKDTWSRVQPKGLDNRLQDLNWQCVHGKLPVREILYRHGLTRHPRCPRPTCAEDENLGHVFWDCGYAQGVWTRLAGLCSKVDPQFTLTKEKVMRGWPQDTRSPFLSRMWLLVSITKRELWNARTTLIRKGTNLDTEGMYRKICADLLFRMESDALTERLKKTMSLLVHSDQTCGVPRRSATWNLHLIRDAISWVGDRKVPLALVSLDQEKAFDRVDHGFLERVLMTFGFGPRFLRWLKTLYTEVGSRVSINGHLSDLVPQVSGVRQGCPLSPLLYALYIEPLAAAIRAHPGVDGLPLPGSGGKVVKLAQYADDTTLFVCSDQSLRLALDTVQAFGKASGAALNLGKSVVKYFGNWADRRDAAGGLALSDGPLKILGVSFMVEGAARANWEERLTLARRKMGLWKARSLSFLGKVLALKVDVLPSLLYLAHVYPMPRNMRRGLTRDVFNLVWGGRYEYVRREVMYLGKDKGGRDVPDFPLKLDCLFFAQLCARLAAPLEHPHQYFVRLWLSWPLRFMVNTWSNSGPKAETRPDHYKHLVRWSRVLPAGLRPEAAVRHRALYKVVLDGRGARAAVGLEKDTWSRVQPKGLDNRLQDLNWQCVHGKLPVREVLYRHGLTRHPRCPRPTCAEDESLGHVFWDCGYARVIWGKVSVLCSKVDPQFQLTREKVMRGWSHDTRSPFLSRMWLLVSVTKRELWNARTSLIQKGTNLDTVGLYKKVCADLHFRMESDVI
ncbi:hypothetical protein NFI96_030424, partial [Prochilodus magdalenae]